MSRLALVFKRFSGPRIEPSVLGVALITMGASCTVALGINGNYKESPDAGGGGHAASSSTDASTSSGASGASTSSGAGGQSSTSSGAGGSPGLPAGTPCTANDQCSSAVCGTDGTGNCCAKACASVGGTCGATACDGTGACSYPAAGTTCGTGSQTCTGGMQTDVAECDGAGACAAPVVTPCGDFTCAGTTCGTTCTIDAQCVQGAFCWQNACVRVKTVSAGGLHTCAITTLGGAQCWGYGSYGQLGTATFGSYDTPQPVSGLTSGVVQISAGDIAGNAGNGQGEDHTCAVTTAGGVLCWGFNSSGQLGNGSAAESNVPAAVTGLSSGVVAVAAGGSQTCALLSGGTVQCWGDGSHTAGAITGLTNVTMISAGASQTCALTDGGGVPVQCWGAGSYVPVGVTGLTDVTSISVGTQHACALTSSGTVMCWGSNSSGQLGNGTTTDSSVPVAVTGLTSATAIAAGGAHTCAIAAGGVQCWGADGYGQLGDGAPNMMSTTPVVVSGLSSGVTSVSAGGAHTCAVTTAGAVECWGVGDALGNSMFNTSTTPVAVQEP